MVQRRFPILTHGIMILLIILILFPVVWVVSTSIRRDEAAFSTKLFTSRITLQNYIDLLIPEKNVPVLVQELQNLISRVKPYDRITQQRSRQMIDKYIKRLESYFDETETRHALAKQSFNNISVKMQENAEKIKSDLIESLKKLTETVQTNIPKISLNDSYAAVLYEKLQNERFNSTTFNILKQDLESLTGYQIDNADTYLQALWQLSEIYKTKVGVYVEEFKIYDKKLSELNFVAQELSKKISTLQSEVLTTNLFLTEAILPEMKSLSEVFQSLVDLKTKIYATSTLSMFPVDDSKMLSTAQQLFEEILSTLNTLRIYADYEELVKILTTLEKTFSEIINRDEAITKKAQYNQFLELYENLRPRLERVLMQTKEIFEETGEKIILLKNLNEKYIELQEDIKDKSLKKANVESKIKEIDESLTEYRRFVELQLFKNQLGERIMTVGNIKSLSVADLTRYSAVLTFIRNFANSYAFKDEISSQLSKTVSDLRWIEEYRDFLRRFENTSKNLDGILASCRALLKDFKTSYEGLLSVSFSGTFVRSDLLTRLSDLIAMEFSSKVKADMTVASRRAGILMDKSPLAFLKNDYKHMDKQLYRIDNIWKQKPKHYFLNWVLNSIIVANIVGVITTLVCAVAAYPFSRMRFRGRKYGLLSFLLIQMFPAVIFMIAIYNLLNFLGRYLTFLGIDTLGGLIFSYLTGIAYNMYLMKGFYDTIPPSLEEAAIVDGATRFQSFYKIILPLARPILVVVFLLVFIGTFNEFVIARIVLQNVKNYTYALGLQTFAVGPYETEWGLFTAAALLGMMPMVILFLSMQRFLVSGLTRGAVKE